MGDTAASGMTPNAGPLPNGMNGATTSGGWGRYAGMAGQVAGVVSQTIGAYKKSSGTKYGFEFQSMVAKRNADIAEMQAADAMLRGQKDEQAVRQGGANVESSQRASFAARGLDLTEGSPLNILTDTRYLTARDVATTRDNTNKEVWALKNQAQNYTMNGQLLQYRADLESPMAEAGGTLLTGAGKVAGSWYALRNRTVTPGSAYSLTD